LEERYDRENGDASSSSSPLFPMVEEFLQGLGSNVDLDTDLDLDLDFDDDPDDE